MKAPPWGCGPAGAEQGAPLRMAGLHTAAASAPRPGAGTDTPGRSRGPVRSRVSTEAKQKSAATREWQAARRLPRTSQREREACPPRGARQGCGAGPTPGAQGLWPVKTKAGPGHSQPLGLGPHVSGQQYTLIAKGGVQTSREACSVAQKRGC